MYRTSDHVVFEWDERKRERVLSQRGIDFLDAIRIFEKPVLESYDLRDNELRCKAIGLVGGVEFALVYVDRGPCRRVITARRAKRNERNRITTIALAEATRRTGEGKRTGIDCGGKQSRESSRMRTRTKESSTGRRPGW